MFQKNLWSLKQPRSWEEVPPDCVMDDSPQVNEDDNDDEEEQLSGQEEELASIGTYIHVSFQCNSVNSPAF